MLQHHHMVVSRRPSCEGVLIGQAIGCAARRCYGLFMRPAVGMEGVWTARWFLGTKLGEISFSRFAMDGDGCRMGWRVLEVVARTPSSQPCWQPRVRVIADAGPCRLRWVPVDPCLCQAESTLAGWFWLLGGCGTVSQKYPRPKHHHHRASNPRRSNTWTTN